MTISFNQERNSIHMSKYNYEQDERRDHCGGGQEAHWERDGAGREVVGVVGFDYDAVDKSVFGVRDSDDQDTVLMGLSDVVTWLLSPVNDGGVQLSWQENTHIKACLLQLYLQPHLLGDAPSLATIGNWAGCARQIVGRYWIDFRKKYPVICAGMRDDDARNAYRLGKRNAKEKRVALQALVEKLDGEALGLLKNTKLSVQTLLPY